MAATGHFGTSIHRSVLWYWLIGTAALLVLFVLATVWLSPAPLVPAQPPSASQIGATGQLVAQHGVSMKLLGERMIENGRAVGDAVWVGYGQHWISDGDALIERARQLTALASHLSVLNAERSGTSLTALEGDALSLQGHGQALVEHAKAMRALTAILQERARTNPDPRLQADVVDSMARTDQMEEAGRRMVTAGRGLADWVDRMNRSLGKS